MDALRPTPVMNGAAQAPVSLKGPATSAGPALRPTRRIRPAETPLQAVEGRNRQLKTWFGLLLVAGFALLPFLRWDRGESLPGQAVLFDPAGRRLFVFMLEFWAQDLPLVMGVLVFAACALFLATTISGRVWCGYTCPHTVWMDMFAGLDRLGRRLFGQNSSAAFGFRNATRIALALLTGFAFVSWFTDAPGLYAGQAPAVAYITVFIAAGCTWVMAALAREHMCLHMCPWPRFQTAFLDSESLVVSYDKKRGERRGKKREPLRLDLGGPDPTGRGDCIDCGRCTAVCPTRIDIREGLQLGCIGCGLCIDACDTVMNKIGRPEQLIRFAPEQTIDRKGPRPKVIFYVAACIISLGFVVWGTINRPMTFAEATAERNPSFVTLSDGTVRNDYALRLAHRLPELAHATVSIEGLPGATVALSSGETALRPNSSRAAEDRLLVSMAGAQGRTPYDIVLHDPAGKELARIKTQFWGPEA